MADFFEGLGKRLSDVASDIGKKTGDTLEIQKIKGDIRSLKRANERELIDIGRMIYEKSEAGGVSDMGCVETLEGVEKRDTEIEKQEAMIARIQGEE